MNENKKSCPGKPRVYVHRMGSWYPLYMNTANEEALRAFSEVISDGPRETPMTAEDLVPRLQGCSAILSLGGGGSHEITGEVLRNAGTVKVVCIAHWCEQLVEAAAEAGVTVTEGSNANTLAVAEWTLGAALMGVRRLRDFDDALKSGSAWSEPRRDCGLLCESTVGIVGLGRVGACAARYFRNMGARVVAHDPYWTEERAGELGVSLLSLADLLRTSDIISLHLPVTSQTRGLLGGREFALIRDGAIFINSARAALYDEAALVAELAKGRFSAYLDVFAQEPLPADHPMRSMRNVTLTPHIAGDNTAMFLRCGREAVETLRDYFDGKGLRNLRHAAPALP